jgi:hypothetical protein
MFLLYLLSALSLPLPLPLEELSPLRHAELENWQLSAWYTEHPLLHPGRDTEAILLADRASPVEARSIEDGLSEFEEDMRWQILLV